MKETESWNPDEFDKDLAAHLRAQARADQGLPPEKKEGKAEVRPLLELESTTLLTIVQATMEQAAYLLQQDAPQKAAITMQMAICASHMALVKVIQEFNTVYVAFKTGTVHVIQRKEKGEVDDESSGSEESLV